MIRLGFFEVSVCPNSGITFENYGTLIFKGRCDIGNASTICVNKNSICEIGDNFTATAGLRLVCGHHVLFGRDCLVGWDCTFLDTDFHFLTREDGTTTNKQGSIIIGANNWFGFGCKVLKNTMTNEDTTIAANTLLSGNYPIPRSSSVSANTNTPTKKIVIGNDSKVRIIKTGLWRDPKNHT